RALGCPPDLSGSDAALAELVAFEAARVHEWFARGLQLLPLLDRRSRACVGAMAGIYHRLLVHIERDPMAVTQRRLSLPAVEKVWIPGKCLVGAESWARGGWSWSAVDWRGSAPPSGSPMREQRWCCSSDGRGSEGSPGPSSAMAC